MNNTLLYNKAIINKLEEIINKCLHLRFGQILWNCDILYWHDTEIHNPFFDESEEIWKRMCQNKVCFPNLEYN